MTEFALAGLVWALCGGLAVAAPGASPQLFDLGGLGGRFSHPQAINGQGQVVGFSDLPGGRESHAALWERGRVTDLGSPGLRSQATALNESGQVVGHGGVRPGGATHAFLWNPGQRSPLDLGTLGGAESRAWGINRAGHVVGSSETGQLLPNGTPQSHAVLWRDRQAFSLGKAGVNSTAIAINDAGVMVGHSEPDAQGRVAGQGWRWWRAGPGPLAAPLPVLSAFDGLPPAALTAQVAGVDASGQAVGTLQGRVAVRWPAGEGRPVELPALSPHDDTRRALGSNARGWVVGAIRQGRQGERAVLWRDRTVVDLNDFVPPSARDRGRGQGGWVLTEATAINDRGWIVGTASHSLTREVRAFLLAPRGEHSGQAFPGRP